MMQQQQQHTLIATSQQTSKKIVSNFVDALSHPNTLAQNDNQIIQLNKAQKFSISHLDIFVNNNSLNVV